MINRGRNFHWHKLLAVFLLYICSSSSLAYAPVINAWQDPSSMKSRYRVQEGDTLYSIACAFDLDYRDLAKANQLSPPYTLKPGDTLSMTIPKPVSNPELQKSDEAMTSGATLNEPLYTQLSSKVESKIDLSTPNIELVEIPSQKKLLQTMEIELPELELKPFSIRTKEPSKTSSQQPLPVKDLKAVQAQTEVIDPALNWSKGRGPWLCPASGKIIRGFNLQQANVNKGIDIAGECGEPVRAVAPGEIVYCGAGLRGYGNLIIIKHDNTFLTLYGHNRKLLVKEGDYVKKGAQIAEMGRNNSGISMLHFEVRRFGKPVNPMNFIHSS